MLTSEKRPRVTNVKTAECTKQDPREHSSVPKWRTRKSIAISRPESLRNLVGIFCTIDVSVSSQVSFDFPPQTLHLQFILQDDYDKVFPAINSLMISNDKLLHPPFGLQKVSKFRKIKVDFVLNSSYSLT